MKTKVQVSRIGIVVKQRNEEAADLAMKLSELLVKRGCQVAFSEESQSDLLQKINGAAFDKKAALIQKSDLVLVLGGDGTYISVARLMKEKSIPVLGVNMGQLGFLTEIKKEEIEEVLVSILDRGECQVSERSFLSVRLERNGKVLDRGIIVNDAVIAKGAIARIISLDLYVDGTWVNKVRADGLIVSTPTGSTAYSLAAGGPIIEPTLGATVIAAICPHSLAFRPLVLPIDAQITLELGELSGAVYLTLDGQDVEELEKGDRVHVQRYDKHRLKLVRSPDRDYFSILREKFSYGARN